MTSRFRGSWGKEGPKSTSPNFDTSRNNHRSIDVEFRREYNENDCPDEDTIGLESNGGRIIRERTTNEDRNGKLRDRGGPGASCYGNERESNEDRESPDRAYHRRSCREDFRCRGTDAEVDDCTPRERRTTLMGKKGASGFAIVSSTGRYDLVENVTDDVILEPRLPPSSISLMAMTTAATNGNSSTRAQTSNGSAKQVKRIEPRRDHRGTIGSLTRGERPVIEDSSIDVTNTRSTDLVGRSNLCVNNNDASNGSKRDRSAKRSARNNRDEEYHSSIGAVARSTEIDDYGSIDRRGVRGARDRSYSPIDRIVNGSNGDSLSRRTDRQRRDSSDNERFYSPGQRFENDEDFSSIDRRSRRHAEGRSYSPPEENDDVLLNGNHDISSMRPERRDKRVKDEEVGSRRLGRSRVEEQSLIHDDDEFIGSTTHRANGSRGENGSVKKYSDIDEDNSQSRKRSSRRKSHAHHKASPEDFDVQIHRYERALRAPRKDSDLTRKSSFKEHESDLSRKSSFEDHQRSRDLNGTKKSTRKQRDSKMRRGSSEDREHERVSRKTSFKTRDPESTRKSSLTGRSVLEVGSTINVNSSNNSSSKNNVRKNGSHNRDRTESLRRERDSSITRRRSSRCSDDDDDDYDDHDRSPWKNDRHSRPLTPPTLADLEAPNDSRDRRSRIASSSKERHAPNEDDFARNYVQDHKDCRGKIHDETGGSVSQGRDRFSSSTRRVASTRSFNDSRQDNNITEPRSVGRTNAVSGQISTRERVVDEEDPRDDVENSGFSTIERNGTTVIRIRKNSESSIGQNEPRSRRRTSHREVVTATRYRKYEDEAEDEDEDDATVERDGQRRDELVARGYRVGPRRLWTNRDAGVQITDLEDGQPCLHCGETCPGFSPHSWRKNCTSCKCPREAHDVSHEEWVSVRARLGLKGEGPNNYVGFDPRDRGLTWAPPGLPPSKVEEYFSMLPEISVPRIGTMGERHRDRQLATQLPKQDLARAYCRHLDSQHSASADDFMAARNEIALDIGSVKEILERGHECGVCHEPLKYGSLIVSASKLGLSYHPSCFQCTQCRELLVDLAYCVHDDALYCERHYAEQLKPRCAACDELIFSGEYTKAMNKDWHSGHFCCWQCDESLTGQRYVLRDEHPYCIKCYESVFANGCEECSKIIGIDSKDLSYKDKHWHEACFLCNKCRVSLVDKQFGSKVDKIYCGNCYDAQFASRCDGCGEIFRAGTKKMEYKTRQWHEKCFCCVVCKNPIGTKSFIPREQEIYCAGCYEDKFATRCVKCNKIITSGGVTYKNEPWHRDCFTCSNCNNSLAGQRFTSRDDKPYCAECFGELFAKRCTACTKPITGIGGTRFISFEDRHWHNNCFICAGCNTSLVGRGFITDGDDIICPECAKQKLSE